MEDDLEIKEECEGGPAWLMTFADLMSLLMSFFVLLLSFSEMDVQKYKQVAGSMKFAFGVQREIKADDIPKGTSIIAQEFSPGQPKPTPIKVMQQKSMEDTQPDLRIRDEVLELAEILQEALSEEIDRGLLEILIEEDEVKIRIRERDSFPSGSANLHESFYPVLDRIIGVLDKINGRVIVAGHTDSIPISTPHYPSNWVLSSARSASVVHYLAKKKLTDPTRIEIRAYADTQPIVPNDSASNRAQNRRVEIIVSFDNYPGHSIAMTDAGNDPGSEINKTINTEEDLINDDSRMNIEKREPDE